MCLVPTRDHDEAGCGGEGRDSVDGCIDGDEVGEQCPDGEAGISPESVDTGVVVRVGQVGRDYWS